MLNRTQVPTAYEIPTQPALAKPEEAVDLGKILALVRRNWWLVSIAMLVCMGGATCFLLLTPPRYFAKANLMLDTKKLQVQQQQPVFSDVNFDAPAVESQIELIRSEALAGSVVKDLKLYEDPEFTDQAHGFYDLVSSRITSMLGLSHDEKVESLLSPSDDNQFRLAIATLRNNLQAQRLRNTYVIEVGYNSPDPDKAARIANGIAEGYIRDQVQTRQESTRRAISWLQERLTELREKAVAADRAVQDFRTKNNLVQAKGGALDDQQLADAASQLAKARELTAEAKLRLDRITKIISDGLPDASMTAWLQNDVISRLRQQYVDVTRREADFAARLGPEHQAVVNLRKDKAGLERSAAGELRRIREGFRNDYEIALSRERAVEARYGQQSQQNQSARHEQGELQVLESAARNYQTLHDNFLQRYSEALQQQNAANSEARVITRAEQALKVFPNTKITFGLASAMGLALGCAAAFAREMMDNVFRGPKQVEELLGLECFGILPAIEGKNKTALSNELTSGSSGRIIPPDIGIARQVVSAPFSRFTETVRSIKVAADTSATAQQVHVMGVVSAVPGEGKSTISANLAQLAAQGGNRALLIDGDLRNPSLTRLMAPGAQEGVIEVLQGKTELAEATWKDVVTGLDFLPTVYLSPIAHTSELLASRRMAELVEQARRDYDYVFIDLPPLAPVVDAKAASHLVDGFVLVIEWGSTSTQVVSECLRSAEKVTNKIIGAVLNRANPNALKRMESYKGPNYHRYYTSYISDA